MLQLGVNGKQAPRLGRLLDPSLADLVLGVSVVGGRGSGEAGLAG